MVLVTPLMVYMTPRVKELAGMLNKRAKKNARIDIRTGDY